MSEWSDSGKWRSRRLVAIAATASGRDDRTAFTSTENPPRAWDASNSLFGGSVLEAPDLIGGFEVTTQTPSSEGARRDIRDGRIAGVGRILSGGL